MNELQHMDRRPTRNSERNGRIAARTKPATLQTENA